MKLRLKLLEDYSDVFKEDLEPSDVMKGEIKAELNDLDITPTHISTPASVPVHLRKAADKELARCLKAGVLEPCNHWTPWVSRGMFVPKATKEGEELRVRLVSDLKGLNKKLKHSLYPNESSQALLKRLNNKHRYFSCIDFSSGYHQCLLRPEDRDYFAILLPQGKFRYTRWAQGAAPSGDNFLILSDPGLRGRSWI